MREDRCGTKRSACFISDSPSGPLHHASGARVPISARIIRRSFCGPARPRRVPGSSNRIRFSSSSGTASVEPLNPTSRRPRYHAPGVEASASGRTQASRSASNGSAPSRVRAREIDDLFEVARHQLRLYPAKSLHQAAQHFPSRNRPEEPHRNHVVNHYRRRQGTLAHAPPPRAPQRLPGRPRRIFPDNHPDAQVVG